MLLRYAMKKSKCSICLKKVKLLKYDLGKFPLCDDLIKIGSSKKNKLYKIILRYCEGCNTVFNIHKIKKTKIFSKNYHYRAKLTKDVLNGQKNLVETLIKNYGSINKKTFLDIGCNDGALLDVIKKRGGKTIGVEPTNAANDANKIHKIYKAYFNGKTADEIKKRYKTIDYITFTNVFAHINNFVDLIRNLKKLISNETKLVVENHYLGSVIEKFQFDSFYHEHPRTYSLTSFFYISKLLGLNIEYFEFPKRYGGNIRVIMSKSKQSSRILREMKIEKKFFRFFDKNLKKFQKWTYLKNIKIKKLNEKFGPLKAKAFPARASLIIKFLGLNEKNIDFVYEKTKSKKIGYYVPGTKIQIRSDKFIKNDLKNYKGPIVNLAWHIEKEIKNYLTQMNIKNKLINIIDKKEIKQSEY